MSAHLTLQIATNRRLKTRARQYARASFRRGLHFRKRDIRSGRERFDFMEEIKAPSLELGSSISLGYKDTNSWVSSLNDLFRKKVLTKVNDALIAEVNTILERVTSTHEYLKEDAQAIIDFLNTHKGQRCYAKWW